MVTKKELGILRDYNRYLKSDDTIYTFYGKPSYTKVRIWEDIIRKYPLARVLGGNCMTFTVGAVRDNMFVKITKGGGYEVSFCEIEDIKRRIGE